MFVTLRWKLSSRVTQHKNCVPVCLGTTPFHLFAKRARKDQLSVKTLNYLWVCQWVLRRHLCTLTPGKRHPFYGAIRANNRQFVSYYWGNLDLAKSLQPSENGAPGGIRTPDQEVRSLLLYPAELRVRYSTQNM